MYLHLYLQQCHRLTPYRHDLSSTFDVRVGQLPGNVKRFTIHTDIFTRRSKFLASASKPEWAAGDSARPVDLSDVNPDVFQAYLNCVYTGPETLEETPGAFEREVRGGTTAFSVLFVCNVCEDVTRENLILRFEEFGSIKAINFNNKKPIARFESSRIAKIVFSTAEAGEAALRFFDGSVLHGHRLSIRASQRGLTDLEACSTRREELADLRYTALIKLYLLADKLQDIITANTVIDKIRQFHHIEGVHPGKMPISTAYQFTMEGSPLRELLRNMWLYNTTPKSERRFQESEFLHEFLHDVLKLYMSIKNSVSIKLDSFSNIKANDQLGRETPSQCRYHQHDNEHPFCPPESKDAGQNCRSCREAREA